MQSVKWVRTGFEQFAFTAASANILGSLIPSTSVGHHCQSNRWPVSYGARVAQSVER